jgi:hypothetical protein
MQAKRDGKPGQQLLLMERAVALQPDNAKIKSQHAKLLDAATESVLADLEMLKLAQTVKAEIQAAEPPPPAPSAAKPAPAVEILLKRDEKDMPMTDSRVYTLPQPDLA